MELVQTRIVRRRIPYMGTVMVQQYRNRATHMHRNQYNQLLIVLEEGDKGIEWGEWVDVPVIDEETQQPIPELMTRRQFTDLVEEVEVLQSTHQEGALLGAWPRINTLLKLMRRSIWCVTKSGVISYKTDK